MKYPNTILNLIECFKKLPGVGEKSAERMALSLLKFDNETINLFSENLKNIKTKICKCINCNNISEENLCIICRDKNRNNKFLCIVEDSKNIIMLEKLNIFNGYYYVLGGLISPIDGINPDDLNLEKIIEKVGQNEIEEVILALRPSIEGETTSLYITKMLEKKNVKITKIAHGIPMGADIDYVDSLTLELALENRIEVSKNKDS